ncbi:MAG: phosphatidylglycerophosphatase A [Candidatus Omnitrophica bacterium]|nr:phosphatidylglycerophosphatase A [Candidatus Omnitrophota bacterium]
MKRAATLIASFFYLGKFPFAQGTVGSLGGVALYLLFWKDPALYTIVMIASIILGVWSAGVVERSVGIKDPSIVVIDEVAGFLVAFFMIPYKLSYLLIGFIIFRLFDIIKPPPAKAAEGLREGWGIMTDDLIAGLYTQIILRIITRFI